jgi:FAD/FMN-containing dehydrogenase
MALTTRRQFVQQTALGAVAVCGRPIKALAEARLILEAREQNAAPVDTAAIRKLVSQINGHVITPDAPDYESSRLVFNRAFDRRPALIVRCADASDVARALEFAQNQNLPLAVRGGGHNRAGFSVCDDGLVIDLSVMNRVEVDAGKRLARAQAGALVRDMDKATQQFGLATTMGGCPTVGIAGLTLGGGEGFLQPKYGTASDNLISAQLVTLDGRQVEASEKSNPDLFWAIRGGGGNFGVATALEYRLHPVSEVLAGNLTYSAGRIPELLEAFVKFTEGAPDDVFFGGAVLPSEHGPKFLMMLLYFGATGHGNSLVRTWQDLKPLQDTVKVTSYLEAQSTINPYAPIAHFQTDLVLPELSPSTIATIAAAAKDAPPNTRVFIFPFFGATTRVGVSDTAYPLRQFGYELDIIGSWKATADKAAAIEWVKALRGKLRPVARGAYVNQLGETSEELVKLSYGSNYARLAEVKKKYDPKNLLRLNQNIEPNQDLR